MQFKICFISGEILHPSKSPSTKSVAIFQLKSLRCIKCSLRNDCIARFTIKMLVLYKSVGQNRLKYKLKSDDEMSINIGNDGLFFFSKGN